MTTTTTTTTWTKLKSGEFGLRGRGLTEGATVTVTKKDGTTSTATVGKVLWRGDDGMCLATVAGRASSSSGRGGRGRGTWTGCSCGSVEEYARASDCRSCRHDRD
jgi:hypothetical protein